MHLGNRRLDCIDLATGESRWRTESFGRYWSMAWQGDKILALDERGELLLIRADPERFELLDRREIGSEESWGHVAVAGERVFVRERESDIVPVLDALLRDYPELQLGSYPRVGEEAFHVMLTLESRDAGYLQDALDALLAKLPESAIHKVE